MPGIFGIRLAQQHDYHIKSKCLIKGKELLNQPSVLTVDVPPKAGETDEQRREVIMAAESKANEALQKAQTTAPESLKSKSKLTLVSEERLVAMPVRYHLKGSDGRSRCSSSVDLRGKHCQERTDNADAFPQGSICGFCLELLREEKPKLAKLIVPELGEAREGGWHKLSH